MRIICKVPWAVLAMVVTTLVLFLSACGQTGDLYLPEPEKQEKQQKKSD
jgi:predicted small lipoprotein YifL